MKIVSFQVENHKSFRQATHMEFGSGFNVLVGKNNVGKTALLEAISLQFTQKPHRSLETMPFRHSTVNPSSQIKVNFEFTGHEFFDYFQRNNTNPETHFLVPFPREMAPNMIQNFLENVHPLSGIRIENKFWDSGSQRAFFADLEPTTEPIHVASMSVNTSLRKIKYLSVTSHPNANLHNNLLLAFLGHMRDKIYSFKAERLNIGLSANNRAESLLPDASNLPAALHTLNSDTPHKFQRYMNAIRLVFPNITQITIPQNKGNQLEIKVWEVESSSDRDDLAMSLSECGTGISQVLAMLYVVLTAEDSRIIIIDEPQSFLHPGAIRKLFEIFRLRKFEGRDLPEHQYIISTHSPTVITAANPSSLILVKKIGSESTVEPIDINETNQLRLYLQEIGASLSDVFGVEQILWVEGKTEELCFPLILSELYQEYLSGAAIIGIIHTGDFEDKHKRVAFEIYQNLSKGKGILPPAIGFIFDRENRAEQEIKELKTLSDGAIHFTHRKMFENYLLNSSAISAVLSATIGSEVPPDAIETWFERDGWLAKYFPKSEPKRTPEIWLQKVDGAKVLEDIFKEFSEQKYPYEKITHGLQLTKWLIENRPQELDEIAQLLLKAMKIESENSG